MNVDDPFDFPTNPPGLRQLDGALRCSICSELYDAPVSLPCGHTFCSLCIRRSMETSDKSACAQCRKDVMVSQLRPVQVIEDAVSAWKLARAALLLLLKERITAGRPPPSKKRKLSTSPEPMKRSDTASSQRREDARSAANFVDCPICLNIVPFAKINSHIDNCIGPSDSSSRTTPKPKPSSKGSRDSSKNEWSKLLGGTHKSKGKNKVDVDVSDPLPTPTYPTLKDKQLKELLNRHDLPTTSGRDVWIQRHRQWVLLFNSNLDRSPSQRHSIDQLRAELKRWEQQKGVGSKVKKSGQLKVDVEDNEAYQRAHKDQFAALVEAARPKGKRKADNAEESDFGSSSNVEDALSSSVIDIPSSPRQSPDTMESALECTKVDNNAT